MEKRQSPKPFINIGPGYTIKKFLVDRGWSQEDLADLTGISTKQLSQIINNRVRITVGTAKLLAKAFSTSAELWINLDTNYRMKLDSDNSRETATQRKAHIRKYMPVSEILKKGWFTYEKTAEGYESLYKNIWDSENTDGSVYEKPDYTYSARQETENEKYTSFYTLTWQQIARSKSRELAAPHYNQGKLEHITQHYTDYTLRAEGIRQIIRELYAAGVKFFVLSHLSKTCIDGACFFEKENPVIVYTGRYDRIDNFWLTLAHEIAHVLLHLSGDKTVTFIDDLDGKIAAKNKREEEADRKAEELLRMDEIIQESMPFINYLSDTKLNSLANKLRIEPSLFLGVLQHKGLVEYRKLNKYKKSALEQIPPELVKG